MSTLAEIENALPSLTMEELTGLEQALETERHQRLAAGASSALDLAPLDLGRTLVPFVRDDEFFDELLDK